MARPLEERPRGIGSLIPNNFFHPKIDPPYSIHTFSDRITCISRFVQN
jgi:hypothetical protein